MNKNEIILETEKFVYRELHTDASGHDWWHIYHVTNIARTIAQHEGADMFICVMAALLHDIADEKLNVNEFEGLKKVREWLISQTVDEVSIAKILDIISSMSFKGGGQPPMKTIEGKIVQDADRLDAIGAIGIARTFAFSGANNQLIYDPTIQLRDHITIDEYRKRNTTAIHHFHEKLLKLKELINTDYGKKLAERKHKFMEEYLVMFFKEWNG